MYLSAKLHLYSTSHSQHFFPGHPTANMLTQTESSSCQTVPTKTKYTALKADLCDSQQPSYSTKSRLLGFPCNFAKRRLTCMKVVLFRSTWLLNGLRVIAALAIPLATLDRSRMCGPFKFQAESTGSQPHSNDITYLLIAML